MTRWSSRTRVGALIASFTLFLGATALAGNAEAATPPTASVGEVTCVAEDGQLVVTLNAASDGPTTFVVFVDGSTVTEDESETVEAGGSAQVTASGLEDGDHSVEVIDVADATLAEETRTVACDVAPVGAYSNAHGSVYDACAAMYVEASNKPVGGNVDDLQPVDFTVTYVRPDEAAVVLDSFTLDAATRTYERYFDSEELGAPGTVTLTAAGSTVAEAEYAGDCEVVATAGSGETGGTTTPVAGNGDDSEGGDASLPNTGA